MSPKNILIIIVLAVVLVGGGIFYWSNKKTGSPPAAGTAESALVPREAWVEIIRPEVSLQDESGTEIKKLSSGDAVVAGMTLAVGGKGLAIVHFPDGSTLRADAASIFKLDLSSFEQKTETLSVKISLISGRLWSKVIAIVSPDSVWQVKTSSAVATVRGTAFGVEYRKGASRFLGSEHAVKVAVLDPKTKEPLPKTEAELTPKTIVAVSDSEAVAIAAVPKELSVVTAPKAVLTDVWVKDNEAADTVIDKTLAEVRQTSHSDAEAREKLRQVIDKRREEVKQEENQTPEKAGTLEDTTKRLLEINQMENPVNEATPVKGENNTSTNETVKTSGTVTAKPVKLVIRPVPGPLPIANPGEVAEGTKAGFKAILVLSDGSEQDVTKDAVWEVSGHIGSMVSPGILAAAFDEAESELPSVSGEVKATYTAESGVLIAPPVPVTVVHSIEETTPLG